MNKEEAIKFINDQDDVIENQTKEIRRLRKVVLERLSIKTELIDALIEIKRLYGDRKDYIGEYKLAWEQIDSLLEKEKLKRG